MTEYTFQDKPIGVLEVMLRNQFSIETGTRIARYDLNLPERFCITLYLTTVLITTIAGNVEPDLTFSMEKQIPYYKPIKQPDKTLMLFSLDDPANRFLLLALEQLDIIAPQTNK